MLAVRVRCNDEEQTLKVSASTAVAAVERSLALLFATPCDGWGLYRWGEVGGEGWLSGRHALSWYVPLDRLEWRERARVAELVFVNGTRTRVRVDDSAPVASLVAAIGAKLGLAAAAVAEFGLKFGGQLSAGLTDKDALTGGWLDERLTLQQHGVTAAAKLELRWLKRFFLSDHSVTVSDDVALHYTFLECRSALLNDQLDLSGAALTDVVTCAALLLHVDHGRFDRRRHTAQWYAGKRYVPDSWAEVGSFSRLAAAWKALADDVVPKKVFCDMCRQFPGFACTFFDGVTWDGDAKCQLSVNAEKVVGYQPWSAPRLGLVRSQRRLSRAALALSPRGERSSTVTDELDVMRSASLRSTGGGNGSLTRTLGARLNKARHEDEGDGARADEAEGTAAAATAATAEGSSGSRIPLVRSLRSGKKSSSPNLLPGRGGGGGSGGASTDSTSKLAGSLPRFKSFGGLRDLSLKRRGSSRPDPPAAAPAVPAVPLSAIPEEGGSVIEEDAAAGGEAGSNADELEAAVAADDVEIDAQEGRQELFAFALEEVLRWSVRGGLVVLDVSDCDATDGARIIELAFASPEHAAEFSDLLNGYLVRRIAPSPAEAGASHTETVQAPGSAVDAAGGGRVVVELFARFETACAAWSGVRPPELENEFGALRRLMAPVLSAGCSSEAAGRARSVVGQVLLLLPPQGEAGTDRLRAAARSLDAALACSFPPTDADEDGPGCGVFDALRRHGLTVVVTLSSLATGLRAWDGSGGDAAALEGLVDKLLAALEDAVLHPAAVEPHQRLASVAVASASLIVRPVRAARKLQGVGATADAVRACARFSRDALSVLLSACALLDDLVGDPGVDRLVLALWNAEQALRCRRPATGGGGDVAWIEVALGVVASCRALCRQSTWDGVVPCVERVLKGLRAAASVPGGGARLGRTVQGLAELVPPVLAVVRSAYLAGAALSVRVQQARLEELLRALMRSLLGGASLWVRSRKLVRALELELAALSSMPVLSAPLDQREWEETWKGQTTELSGLLKALRTAVRLEVSPKQATLGLMEAWATNLTEVVRAVRTLIAPFYVADAPPGFDVAASNIVRSVHWLGSELCGLIDQVCRCELEADAAAGVTEAQADVARAGDACLSAINANGPAVAATRQHGGDMGGSWTRRGEMSSQGASLRLKLTKQNTEKNSFLARKKKDQQPPTPLPLSSSPTSSSGALPTAAESPSTSSPLMKLRKATAASPTGSAGGSVKSRRQSGDWDEASSPRDEGGNKSPRGH